MKKKEGRRRKPWLLVVRDAQGGVRYRGRLDALPIPDAVIRAMSMEFYNDPAPCFLPAGAVRSRALAEIEQALTAGQFLPIPPEIRRYFSAFPAADAALAQDLS